MTENEIQNESENLSDSESPSPPTEPTSGEPAKASEPPRFTQGVLAGKTEADVLDEYSKLVSAIQYLSAPKPQPQTQEPVANITADPYSDPEEYQRQLRASLQQEVTQSVLQQVNQAAIPLMQQNAAMARHAAASDKRNAEIFERYGAEIDNMLSNIPYHMRTKEMYDKAVGFVKAEHFDDLMKEEIQRRTPAGDGLARSDDYGAPAPDGAASAFERLAKSPYGSYLLKNNTKADIVAHAKQRGMKLDDYVELVERTGARPDPRVPGRIINTELVR